MPTFNTTTPKPGYVYDSSDDTWYPLAGIATQSLDGLTDVVISSAASGQTLVYDGTNWVNTAETGDVSAVSAGTGITVTNGTGPIPSIAVDDTLVATTSNTMTLTNKTINLSSNTLTGTLAEFNTAVSDANLVSIAGSETLTNKTLTSPTLTTAVLTGTTQFAQVLETASVTSFAATGTFAYDVLNQAAVTYFNSNAGANWTLNIRGSATTSLLDMMSVGQSLTIALLVTQGSPAYYQSGLQIDSSSITPKWQGGSAPSSGNANSIDSYSASILKVANTSTVSSAFTVLMAQNRFA
jgi:hypothetical protein